MPLPEGHVGREKRTGPGDSAGELGTPLAPAGSPGCLAGARSLRPAPVCPLQAVLSRAPWARASGTGSPRSSGSCSCAADASPPTTGTPCASCCPAPARARWTAGPSSATDASDAPALPLPATPLPGPPQINDHRCCLHPRCCLEGGWARDSGGSFCCRAAESPLELGRVPPCGSPAKAGPPACGGYGGRRGQGSGRAAAGVGREGGGLGRRPWRSSADRRS